jgi:hypothetical protein
MSLSKEQRGCLRELACQAQGILSESQQSGGRPMTFAELEEASIEAGDFMTAMMMQAEIEQRPPAAQPPCCPTCERAGELQAEPEARVLQTDRGEVAWLESSYYCRRCRRSFFPSVA